MSGAIQFNPYPVKLEEGNTYAWCSCGKSKKQPFCDGSHMGTGVTPVRFTAEESKTVFLCGCKESKNKPFCDGTHSSISQEDGED